MQYPQALANSYFEVNFGYIYYPFTAASLEPGYTVKKIDIPRNSLRIVLYGHNFNKHLATQVTYTRPLNWAEYTAIGGTNNYNIDSILYPIAVQASKCVVLEGVGCCEIHQ